MPGLVPGIPTSGHRFANSIEMAGTSPAMTNVDAEDSS
jgi:hypothetical protein